MGDLIRVDLLVTQILGFLIVLWVLRKYAWGPILNMLEERRSKIAHDVDSARKLREEAETLKAEYEQHLRTIETQTRQRMQEAIQEGQKVAEEIRAKAHAEARQIAEKAKSELDQEVKKARVELRKDMVTLSLGAAERLLQRSIDGDEQRRLVDSFLDELQEQEAR
jgi:F-type H+-transporting ATPase subunit b